MHSCSLQRQVEPLPFASAQTHQYAASLPHQPITSDEESTDLEIEAVDGSTRGVAQDYGEEEAAEPRLTGISEPLGVISLHDIMATSDQAESGPA